MPTVSRFIRKAQPELASLPNRLRELSGFPGLWKAAAPAHEGAIRQFVTFCRAEYAIQWIVPENCDLLDIENNYTRNGGVLAILENNSDILGTLGLHRLNAGTCELAKFYLSPALRHRGLGATILDTAIGLAKDTGFQKILLETSPVFRAADQLYRSRGFRTTTTQLSKLHLEEGVHLELDMGVSHV